MLLFFLLFEIFEVRHDSKSEKALSRKEIVTLCVRSFVSTSVGCQNILQVTHALIYIVYHYILFWCHLNFFLCLHNIVRDVKLL